MKKYLISKEGNFYKSNLHCHSDWSDGHTSIEDLKKAYKGHGYSVLCITDHDGLIYHPELNDPDFLTIGGYEIEINGFGKDWPSTPTCHLCLYKKDPSDMNMLGRDKFVHSNIRWMHNPEMEARVHSVGEPIVREYTPENINAIIMRFRNNGFLVTYNHPKWSMENYATYSLYDGMNNLEIFNTGCYRMGFDEYNGEVYDVLLRQGKRVHCVATDDNHTTKDFFGGFTMLKAPSLTYENIIKSFEDGNFYSSTGPILSELYYEDGRVTVKSKTPLHRARMLTGRRYVAFKEAPIDEKFYEVSFDVNPDSIFFRLELEDTIGNKAFTNGYFLEDIK